VRILYARERERERERERRERCREEGESVLAGLHTDITNTHTNSKLKPRGD
jgi:ATP-dependent RNA circularization protein (DNA/RNA ligase family)